MPHMRWVRAELTKEMRAEGRDRRLSEPRASTAALKLAALNQPDKHYLGLQSEVAKGVGKGSSTMNGQSGPPAPPPTTKAILEWILGRLQLAKEWDFEIVKEIGRAVEQARVLDMDYERQVEAAEKAEYRMLQRYHLNAGLEENESKERARLVADEQADELVL